MARTLLSRFGSKKDLSSNQLEFQCAIRLLDDEEVLQTSFQVTRIQISNFKIKNSIFIPPI